MKAQLHLHNLPDSLFKIEKTSIVGFRLPRQSTPSASSATSNLIMAEEFQKLSTYCVNALHR